MQILETTNSIQLTAVKNVMQNTNALAVTMQSEFYFKTALIVKKQKQFTCMNAVTTS